MQENRHVNCNCHGTLSGKMKRLKRTFPEYSACFYFLFNKLKCTCHLNTNSMSCFATLIAPVTVFTNWWWMKPPPNSSCSTNRRFLVKSGFPPAPPPHHLEQDSNCKCDLHVNIVYTSSTQHVEAEKKIVLLEKYLIFWQPFIFC